MKYLLLNHKMNLLAFQMANYLDKLPHNPHLVVFPSAIYIPYFLGKGYRIGSQDVSSRKMGAVTSEVSAEQLKSLGVSYCLVGHSEWRKYHFEEEKEIAKKIEEATNSGLIAVLCIGEETKEEKYSILTKQLEEGLKFVEKIDTVWIAYEPLANIGSGIALAKEEINETILWIKEELKRKYQQETKVLYGGSVSSKNCHDLKDCLADGFLVGNASLNPEEVEKMIKELETSGENIS